MTRPDPTPASAGTTDLRDNLLADLQTAYEVIKPGRVDGFKAVIVIPHIACNLQLTLRRVLKSAIEVISTAKADEITRKHAQEALESDPEFSTLRERAEAAERERDEARSTNRDLQRRMQAAEGPLLRRAEKAEWTAQFWLRARKQAGARISVARHRAEDAEARLATLAAENEALRKVVKPFANCWRPHKAPLEFTTIQVRTADLAAAHRLGTELTYGGTHADPA